jgi:hypothetical protein
MPVPLDLRLVTLFTVRAVFEKRESQRMSQISLPGDEGRRAFIARSISRGAHGDLRALEERRARHHDGDEEHRDR